MAAVLDSADSGQQWTARLLHDSAVVVEESSYERLVGRLRGIVAYWVGSSVSLREGVLIALMREGGIADAEFAGRKMRWMKDGRLHRLEMAADEYGRERLMIRVNVDCPVCGQRRTVYVGQPWRDLQPFDIVFENGMRVGQWRSTTRDEIRTCGRCVKGEGRGEERVVESAEQ